MSISSNDLYFTKGEYEGQVNNFNVEIQDGVLHSLIPRLTPSEIAKAEPRKFKFAIKNRNSETLKNVRIFIDTQPSAGDSFAIALGTKDGTAENEIILRKFSTGVVKSEIAIEKKVTVEIANMPPFNSFKASDEVLFLDDNKDIIFQTKVQEVNLLEPDVLVLADKPNVSLIGSSVCSVMNLGDIVSSSSYNAEIKYAWLIQALNKDVVTMVTPPNSVSISALFE